VYRKCTGLESVVEREEGMGKRRNEVEVTEPHTLFSG
jgi:hypothetical protein